MRFKLLIILLFAALGDAFSQGNSIYQISPMPVCWTTPENVDSNLISYWVFSSRDPTPKVVSYITAVGTQVVVAGGSIQHGFCCCSGSNRDSLGITISNDTLTLTQNGITYIYAPSISSTSVTGGDTITQAGHGLFIGQMVGQEAGDGDYFPARSVTDSFPVAFVSEIIDANTFVVQAEGWLTWTHGLSPGTDYFLLEDGSFSPTPDSNYHIFAWRTFGANKAYFDVPELIVTDGGSGGGGGGPGTDLSYSPGVSPVTLFSSTGADVTNTAGTYIQLNSSPTNLTISVENGVSDTIPLAGAWQNTFAPATTDRLRGADRLGITSVSGSINGGVIPSASSVTISSTVPAAFQMSNTVVMAACWDNGVPKQVFINYNAASITARSATGSDIDLSDDGVLDQLFFQIAFRK